MSLRKTLFEDVEEFSSRYSAIKEKIAAAVVHSDIGKLPVLERRAHLAKRQHIKKELEAKLHLAAQETGFLNLSYAQKALRNAKRKAKTEQKLSQMPSKFSWNSFNDDESINTDGVLHSELQEDVSCVKSSIERNTAAKIKKLNQDKDEMMKSFANRHGMAEEDFRSKVAEASMNRALLNHEKKLWKSIDVEMRKRHEVALSALEDAIAVEREQCRKCVTHALNALKDRYDARKGYMNSCRNQNSRTIKAFLNQLGYDIVILNHQGLNASDCKSIAYAVCASKSIATLSMKENSMGDDACVMLSTAIKECNQIKRLHLDGNRITARGLSALLNAINTESCGVRILTLSNNCVKTGSHIVLERVLSNPLAQLQILNLSYNILGPSSGRAIGLALVKNTTLKELYLQWNKIGTLGGDAIALAIRHNSTLETLNISGNGIHSTTAIILGSSLQQNKTLKHLYLRSNCIGDEGGIAIAASLAQHNATLSSLDIGDNLVSEKGSAIMLASLVENKVLSRLSMDELRRLINAKTQTIALTDHESRTGIYNGPHNRGNDLSVNFQTLAVPVVFQLPLDCTEILNWCFEYTREHQHTSASYPVSLNVTDIKAISDNAKANGIYSRDISESGLPSIEFCIARITKGKDNEEFVYVPKVLVPCNAEEGIVYKLRVESRSTMRDFVYGEVLVHVIRQIEGAATSTLHVQTPIHTIQKNTTENESVGLEFPFPQHLLPNTCKVGHVLCFKFHISLLSPEDCSTNMVFVRQKYKRIKQ